MTPQHQCCGRTLVADGSHEKRDRQAAGYSGQPLFSLFFLWGAAIHTPPIFLSGAAQALVEAMGGSSWITGGCRWAIGVSAPIAGWLLDRIEARFRNGCGAP